jgi:ubiquitin
LKNSQYAISTYLTYYRADKTCIKSVVQTDVVDVLSDKGDYIKTLDASYTDARYIRVSAVLVPNPSTTTTIEALTSKDQLANCKLALNETITD